MVYIEDVAIVVGDKWNACKVLYIRALGLQVNPMSIANVGRIRSETHGRMVYIQGVAIVVGNKHNGCHVLYIRILGLQVNPISIASVCVWASAIGVRC